MWNAQSMFSHSGSRVQAEAPSDDYAIRWPDYLAIGIYFVLIFIVGFWSSRKSNQNTVDGYFLAGRGMNWILVGASIFSSNIGSEHYIGLAGSGATSGIAIVTFEYVAMYVLLILGWFFMPVYMASNISTMPEYLKKRFGGQRIRIYLSVLALILYIFTKISASLYAGAIFIKLLLKIDNIFLATIILIIVSALFTIVGGLTAVIWTDSIQTLLMLIGAMYLSVSSINAAGGYNDLMENFRTKGLPNGIEYQSFLNGCDPTIPNNTCISCSAITPHYKNLFRPIDDLEMPITGILGVIVSTIWYWCTDQVIVQRALSAKNLTHAKGGCVMAGLLKALPMYLLVLPGMASRVLWPNEIGCSNPDFCQKICNSKSGCSNYAYAFLIIRLMPTGATGLMFSAILAALMSSLTSIFNSASTIFIIDIYTRFRHRASDIEQIIVGRFFVVILVAISVIWIPILEQSQNSQLFSYIQSVTAYLAPPLCAVYILAVFWDRTTEPGAFWALAIGLVIGLIRFVMDYALPAPACGSMAEDIRPLILSKVHFLHFGMMLFTISLIIAIVISLMTKKIQSEYLYRLTYSSRFSEEPRMERLNEAENNQNNYEIQDPEKKSNVEKYFMVICCASSHGKNTIENQSDTQIEINSSLNKLELAKLHADSARDDPRYVTWTNLGAIITVAVCSFFWGLYA